MQACNEPSCSYEQQASLHQSSCCCCVARCFGSTRTWIDWPHTYVLLIEDDRAVLRSIVRLLRSRAYRVLTAQSGADSLRVIEEHTDVDVVLIDIVLPDMSGMQVAALIETKHPNTPVIFATGVGNVGELKGIEEGRLLRKPFTERDLFDKLSAALKRG